MLSACWPVGGRRATQTGDPMIGHGITERARSERHARIREDLLQRMRPVCLDMPEDLFLELIETMAALQLRYEMHEGSATIV